MEIKDITNDARRRMDSAVEDARKKLAAVRTGRASVSLLDNVRVEYYGTEMPLNQVATIHAPEPTLITLQPFDPTQLGPIEKAIRASELGLKPRLRHAILCDAVAGSRRAIHDQFRLLPHAAPFGSPGCTRHLEMSRGLRTSLHPRARNRKAQAWDGALSRARL